MGEMSRKIRRLLWWALAATMPAWALAADQAGGDAGAQPAAALYRQLRSVGLDPGRVYQVREAGIDREDIHITLTEGTLAFTESVEGRITGAFFEGDGEVLLVPPDRVERSSLALFTGAAILEEKFATAYFRFNDNTFELLQPYLRPAESPEEFVSKWNAAARSLAAADALRLLESFTWQTTGPPGPGPGKLLHARISGQQMGTFDVFLDTDHEEHISAGQASYQDAQLFYNLWASFPMQSVRQARRGPEGAAPRPLAWRDVLRTRKYRLKVRVLPPSALEGEAVLTVEARESGPRALVFELSRFLQVSSVTADGRPVEVIQNEAIQGSELARKGNDLVAVVLPQPLEAGRSLELRFTYAGSVLSEAGGGLMYVGARGTWYPNRGAAMAEFDLEFRYPAAWTLVATGKRVALEEAGGEQVSRWVSERPMPLAGFNLGKYVSGKARSGDTTVETYAARQMESAFPASRRVVVTPPPQLQRKLPRMIIPPAAPVPSPSVQAQKVAEKAARVVDFLAPRIGPFPYSSLALTQMPGRESQGWPGLVFLSSFAFLSPEERQRLDLDDYGNVLYEDLMQAHETAHQWWGDSVFSPRYRDLWVFEALANYSALLAIESRDPERFRTVMEQYRRELMRKSKDGMTLRDAGPVTLARRLSSSRLPGAYEAVVYGRGTWLIHMLRHMLRNSLRDQGAPRKPSEIPGHDPDARFYQVLRGLVERFRDREMSTADVQKAFEEALPDSLAFDGRKSLDWFFDGWVKGTALPRFEVANLRFSQKSGKTVVSGELLQKEAPETLVTSVPLYAARASKTVYLGRVFADGPETEFRFPVPAGIRKILVDPYQTVLTRP